MNGAGGVDGDDAYGPTAPSQLLRHRADERAFAGARRARHADAVRPAAVAVEQTGRLRALVGAVLDPGDDPRQRPPVAGEQAPHHLLDAAFCARLGAAKGVLLDEADDVARVGAGREDCAEAHRLQRRHVLGGDDAARQQQDVVDAAGPQLRDDAREQLDVRAGQRRQPDDVDVFLQRSLGDHLRRLSDAGVDDLHAGVAQGPRDNLGAAVVAVQPRLGDEDAYLLFSHGLPLAAALDERDFDAAGPRRVELDGSETSRTSSPFDRRRLQRRFQVVDFDDDGRQPFALSRVDASHLQQRASGSHGVAFRRRQSQRSLPGRDCLRRLRDGEDDSLQMRFAGHSSGSSISTSAPCI